MEAPSWKAGTECRFAAGPGGRRMRGAAVGLALLLSAGNALPAWMGLLVPAYFGPGQSSDWQALADAADRVPLIAIANVSNGPGAASLSEVASVLQRVRDRGGRVVGYVHTTYGNRAAASVREDVQRWKSFYALDGIFVDEMSTSTATTNLTYYQTLYQDIKAADTNWMVIGNPGTNTREVYLTGPSADLLVVFENRVGYSSYQRDLWTSAYEPSRFAHLGYQVPQANFRTYLGLARTRRAGWVYFTDDALPNPWDRLPAYWAAMVSDLETRNASEAVHIALRRQAEGGYRLEIQSIPGQHQVQASVDLVTWSDWFSVRLNSDRADVGLPWSPGTLRYVRVVR